MGPVDKLLRTLGVATAIATSTSIAQAQKPATISGGIAPEKGVVVNQDSLATSIVHSIEGITIIPESYKVNLAKPVESLKILRGLPLGANDYQTAITTPTGYSEYRRKESIEYFISHSQVIGKVETPNNESYFVVMFVSDGVIEMGFLPTDSIIVKNASGDQATDIPEIGLTANRRMFSFSLVTSVYSDTSETELEPVEYFIEVSVTGQGRILFDLVTNPLEVPYQISDFDTSLIGMPVLYTPAGHTSLLQTLPTLGDILRAPGIQSNLLEEGQDRDTVQLLIDQLADMGYAPPSLANVTALLEGVTNETNLSAQDFLELVIETFPYPHSEAYRDGTLSFTHLIARENYIDPTTNKLETQLYLVSLPNGQDQGANNVTLLTPELVKTIAAGSRDTTIELDGGITINPQHIWFIDMPSPGSNMLSTLPAVTVTEYSVTPGAGTTLQADRPQLRKNLATAVRILGALSQRNIANDLTVVAQDADKDGHYIQTEFLPIGRTSRQVYSYLGLLDQHLNGVWELAIRNPDGLGNFYTISSADVVDWVREN